MVARGEVQPPAMPRADHAPLFDQPSFDGNVSVRAPIVGREDLAVGDEQGERPTVDLDGSAAAIAQAVAATHGDPAVVSADITSAHPLTSARSRAG